MIWYIAAGILLSIAVIILVMQYRSERHYLRKKTGEVLGKQLWHEIQDERESSQERREKFQKALHEAQDKRDI